MLFSEIGFTNYEWLRYQGYSYSGSGASTTPRQLAKIGQLILNGGAWAGKTLVADSWIKSITTPKVKSVSSMNAMSFGYLWWIYNERGWPYMAGSGGQYVVVIPEKQLLVVSMAEPNTDKEYETNPEEILSIARAVADIAD